MLAIITFIVQILADFSIPPPQIEDGFSFPPGAH